MTILILQIMSSSLYHSTDERLDTYKQKPAEIINLARIRDVFGDGTFRFRKGGDGSTSNSTEATFHISTDSQAILFDKDYERLNETDPVLGLQEIKPNFEDLGSIQEIEVNTSFDTVDSYRYVLVRVPRETDLDTNIAYAMLLVNTTQLKAANLSNQNIIVMVMVSFWLVSIFAALGLTILTVRPIRVAYEKQKAFVENASHELRTPLTVLQNRLESLFRKPEATIMDEFESIASSLDEVRNMRILTTNLLSLARRDGHLTINPKDITSDFFDMTFDNYALIAEEQGKYFTGKNLIRKTIRTDVVLIKQLLTILFDNAVKYTNSNGEIYITSRIRDRHLVVTVEDNGIGIADEDKKKIFDRFYRVDKARTRKNGGLGLGLSLAKQIADGLDGQILVHDRLPHGTIFEARIPLI